MENHIHLLIGLKPVHAIAAVLRELKSGSSEWIRLQKRQADFFWQEGYAAFTVSPTARESVSRYIGSQEEHHRMRTFREELVELLNENGIEFDERYLD
jgi:putative transposase